MFIGLTFVIIAGRIKVSSLCNTAAYISKNGSQEYLFFQGQKSFSCESVFYAIKGVSMLQILFFSLQLTTRPNRLERFSLKDFPA
jgi:hypothetical protein